MSHPLDQLLCDLRDLVDTLREGEGGRGRAGAGNTGAATAADTTQRQFSARQAGQLLAQNDRRAGFVLHNGSDGTLLVALGEEPASVEHYFYAIGPGETWDTRSVPASKNVRKALTYAWVTAKSALGGYPEGVFAEATGGALKVTEFTLPHVPRR